jgi:hypothetical protein
VDSHLSSLDDTIADTLQQVILHNVSLCLLDLSYNSFTHDGIKPIAQTVGVHHSLQTWNISYNWIESTAWYDVLITTNRLHEVILEKCLAPASSAFSLPTFPFIHGRK